MDNFVADVDVRVDAWAMIQLHELANSTAIERYGFEETGPGVGTLALEFGDGALWYYAAVPGRLLERFLLAPSKGQFFYQHIKPFYVATSADVALRRQGGR